MSSRPPRTKKRPISLPHRSLFQALLAARRQPQWRPDVEQPLHVVSTARAAMIFFTLGVNVDEPTGVTRNTVLHLVCRRFGPLYRKTFEVLEACNALLRCLVVDLRVNLEHRNANGNTPLHIMVLNESIDGAALLLRFGADPTVRNHARDTPLEAVASMEPSFHGAMSDMFRRYGDDIDGAVL